MTNNYTGKDEETSLLRDLEKRRLVSRGDGNLPGSKKGNFGEGLDGTWEDLHKRRKDKQENTDKQR
ncbi:MAG: hypothetical protein U0U46_05665 [Saprospiraceae bacterium]